MGLVVQATFRLLYPQEEASTYGGIWVGHRAGLDGFGEKIP